MRTLTVEYPDEVLWALQQNADQFAHEVRLLLAIKLYETGKLSTGLAAQLAGMPRSAFFYLLSQHSISPSGETAAELEEDMPNAQQAIRRTSDPQ